MQKSAKSLKIQENIKREIARGSIRRPAALSFATCIARTSQAIRPARRKTKNWGGTYLCA